MLKYIEFPYFKNIKYNEKNGCYNSNKNLGKQHLEEILLKYDWYCPYCGTDMKEKNSCGIDGNFEKEHTIERKQNGIEYKHLVHCKFNIMVSCSKCNKAKKRGMKSISEKYLINNYYENNCENNCCKEMCEVYKNSLIEYLNFNNIIVQPFGTKDLKTKYVHKMNYDIKERRFCVPEDCVNDVDKLFIENHIKRLSLNDKNSPNALIEIVEQCYEVLRDFTQATKNDFEGKIFELLQRKKQRGSRYRNILDKIFLEKLSEYGVVQQYIIIMELYNEYFK